MQIIVARKILWSIPLWIALLIISKPVHAQTTTSAKATEARQSISKLLQAASGGDFKTVTKLLANGVDVNSQGSGKQTALMAAANHGQSSMIKFLIDYGADRSMKDANGRTSLMLAQDYQNATTASIMALEDGSGKLQVPSTPPSPTKTTKGNVATPLSSQQTISLSSVLSALIGGVAGAVSGFFVNYWRVKRLHDKLTVKAEDRMDALGIARVGNGYNQALRTVFAYITINHELDDVIAKPPDNRLALIHGKYVKMLEDDRLCWCVKAPVEYPACVDILPGENQSLFVAYLHIDQADKGKSWIDIPSEKGFSFLHGDKKISDIDPKDVKVSRVFLKPKRYSGTLKIVSMDTKAKYFTFVIDPSNVREGRLGSLIEFKSAKTKLR